MNIIGKGKLPDFIANPKGSRQFQQFIKLGTKEHRNSAVDALAKQVPDLAMRNIYALLTLEKIITYGLKTDETFLTEKLLKPIMTDRKTIEKLLFHRLGCKFLNKLYLHPAIKPVLKKQMIQIISVPRAIEVLGESKEKLRQYYVETTKRCVDKELLGFEIVQKLLKQAVTDFADDQAFNEEILGMAADGLAHLLSSRDGVYVVVKLLGLASAKHKKNLIKELKAKFSDIAKNSVTSVVLLRLLECVDDTVLVGKSILSELIGSDYLVGKDLLLDVTGRIPFLYCLEGLEMKSGRCYNQQDKQLLAACPAPTAMKDKPTRVAEICSKLVPSVIKIVKSNILEFVQSEEGKDVVIALVRCLSGDLEQQSLVSEIMSCIADIDDFQQPFVTCINAIMKESGAEKECWSQMVARCKQPESLADHCLGLGSFVVMNLIKQESSVSASVRGAVSAVKARLANGNKGTEIILQELAKEGPSMPWSETIVTYKVQAKKRVSPASAAVPVESSKKQKSQEEPEESGELFGDDDEDEEMWGIVGDDDEFLDE